MLKASRRNFFAHKGRLSLSPIAVVLSVAFVTAKKKHLALGSQLRIVTSTQAGSFPVTVSGIATFRTTNPGATLFFFDTATAQTKLLGRPDVFTGVNLDAKPGTADDTLKAEAAAKLGAGYEVKTRAQQEADGRNSVGFIGFLKYVMLGFAGLSLLVGAFLIVNTFQMLVAQRTRELGLLRALGASRRQVNRSVRFEGVLLRVIGSTLGISAVAR